MRAQPVPLAGDRDELVEGECPLPAATVSALPPVRALEKCCMWSVGSCASWEGASLRGGALREFHSPAVKRTTRQNLLFRPLANTRGLAIMLDRLMGCRLMKSNTPLLPHTKKS